MNKKIIGLGIILVILILAIGFVLFNSTSQNEIVEVGKLYYTVPNGYHVEGTNELGHITITNGNEKVYLGYADDKNIMEHIENYKDAHKGDNETINMENFTRGDTTIYKSTIVENGVTHYWFIKDGKTYYIYDWEKNSNIENIFNELFDSVQ